MVKIPHQIIGNTRPTSAGMDPLRVQVDPDAFGAGLARGVEQFGQGLQVLAQRTAQRTEKLDRFQSMSNFSDFELQVNEKLADLKKTADPTGKGFVEQANKMYDIAADEFITKMVPEDMRAEARYWTSNTRQRIIGDSMNFQFEAGNAYFRQGVDKQYQTALKNLDPKTGGDPTRLPAEKESLKAFIDATDLSEIEKAELYRTTAVGLEGVVYKQAVKINLAHGASNVPESVGLVIDNAAAQYGVDAQTLRAIAWLESRGNPKAKNANSSAGGLFQQIDANARQYGVEDRFDAVQSADGAARFTRDNVEFFRNKLGRDPTPGEVYLMHQQGPGNAVRLLQNPNAKASDIASASAIKLNGGTLDMTAGEFAALWDAKMAKAMGVPLARSPLFSNLPYSDQVSLYKDGVSEFNAEQAAAAEIAKLQYNDQLNKLLNNINDGLAGQTEIDAARADWLSDYDDINKAQELYRKRNEEVDLAQRGMDLITQRRSVDPTSEDDKKALNATVGKAGLARIDGMDMEYFTNGIVPAVTAVGDIPTDVAGLLQGMVRSVNQQKALFGYDALAMLQDADPVAYKNRVPDDVEADVTLYRMNRTSMPEDQLFEMLNGGTPQQRQGRAILYQEAQDILKKKEAGVPTLSTMVQTVTSGFNTWTSSAQQLTDPAFAKQLSLDYETAFTNAYIKSMDQTKAQQIATDYINNNWGVSVAGGVLMRNPPEKSGYPMVNKSYDWIDGQARAELGLGEGQRYELISDDQTASEVNAVKKGNGGPPTYQVVVYDEFGVGRLRMTKDVNGFDVPERIYFKKTDAHREIEERQLDLDVENFNLQEYEQFLRGAVARGEMTYERALELQEEAAKRGETLPPAVPNMSNEPELEPSVGGAM